MMMVCVVMSVMVVGFVLVVLPFGCMMFRCSRQSSYLMSFGGLWRAAFAATRSGKCGSAKSNTCKSKDQELF